MVYWIMKSVRFLNLWLGDGIAAGNHPFMCILEILKYADSKIFPLKIVYTKDIIDYHR